MEEVHDSCCNPPDNACTGVLARVRTPQADLICDDPGNHCDANGELTHLDLSESNMRCSLIDVLKPLAEAPLVQDFQLNSNDITGSLDDPKLLSVIARWEALRYLELGNLPKLTGNIPAECPPPFDQLIHLGLSWSNVGGELPRCLASSVHELEIAHTQISGRFPEVLTDNLRCELWYTCIRRSKPAICQALCYIYRCAAQPWTQDTRPD